MLRGSNTLFFTDIINSLTAEVDAVLRDRRFVHLQTDYRWKRKSIASISIYFSPLYVARKIGTEDFSVMSHYVYEHGHDEVRRGNVSQPSYMRSVNSFPSGTAASYPQNRAMRKENPLSPVALALFHREL